MKNEIFTIEAGAGSYPEPPHKPEPEPLDCEECYETRDVAVVDGRALCPHCKADYIFYHAGYNDYMRFICDNAEEQTDFFLSWFFESLTELEKLTAVKPFFKRLPRKEREFHAKSYISESRPDFADFMERTAERYGGV